MAMGRVRRDLVLGAGVRGPEDEIGLGLGIPSDLLAGPHMKAAVSRLLPFNVSIPHPFLIVLLYH